MNIRLEPNRASSVPGNKEHDLRWNFSVNLVERVFGTLGTSIVSTATILPLLVSKLTDSKLAVGVVAAIFTVGIMVPQLITANFTESLSYKRPFVSKIALLGGRLPYLLIAIAVWQLSIPQPTMTLGIVFLLVAISALSGGVIIPAWLDMIAKVIPQRLRGTFFGVGNGVGALLAVVGSLIAGWILENRPFPINFALCYFLSFAVQVISWMGVAATREPPSDSTKTRIPLSSYVQQLPQVLRESPNYVRYLLGRSVTLLGGMASGFMILYATQVYDITGTQVGNITALLVGIQAVSNILWGYVSDRTGHKAILVIGSACMAMAAAALWRGTSLGWVWAAFALLGAGSAASSLSNTNIVLEFGTLEDRPTYIGLTNTTLAPVTMLAPLAGGWLIDRFGFDGMFSLATAVTALGTVLLAFWFREPRRLRSKTPVSIVGEQAR